MASSTAGTENQIVASLALESVTTPISTAVADRIGGVASLTAVLVISTGVFGAVTARCVLNRIHVRETEVRGFAIGVASHGIGTARAFQVSEQMSAF